MAYVVQLLYLLNHTVHFPSNSGLTASLVQFLPSSVPPVLIHVAGRNVCKNRKDMKVEMVFVGIFTQLELVQFCG